MNQPLSMSRIGLLLVVCVAFLASCALDSGDGGGSGGSGRGGSGGASGGTAGVGSGGGAGVGSGGTGPQCSPEVCDDRDNDCNGFVDDGSANDVCRFQLPNAESICARGTCVLGMCLPGFIDCDGNPATGCETPLDLLPCGACNGCPR